MKSQVCTVRHAGLLKSRVRRWLQNPEKILKDCILPGQVVADIGCGPGFFTIPMARLVGPQGRVVAIDLQEEMLAMVRQAAGAEGLGDRITFHRCAADGIGWSTPVDFALVFYMLHEVAAPDAARFLREAVAILKPGAFMLLWEPKFHVSARRFGEEVDMAVAAGLTIRGRPSIWFSRSALFEKCA